MKCLICESIASAHLLLIKHVLFYKQVQQTEDGQMTYEGPTVCAKVNSPLTNMIHPKSSFQQLRCDAYAEQLLQGNTPVPGQEFDYTYHERLYKEGQVDAVLSRINDYNGTRRAVLYTWLPNIDNDRMMKPPCLQMAQILIRQNQVNMHVVMRSNDVLTAFGPNAYGFVRFQESIAKSLGLFVGYYEHVIICPHIYYEVDAEDLKRWNTYPWSRGV